jgi:hypothetical protein
MAESGEEREAYDRKLYSENGLGRRHHSCAAAAAESRLPVGNSVKASTVSEMHCEPQSTRHQRITHSTVRPSASLARSYLFVSCAAGGRPRSRLQQSCSQPVSRRARDCRERGDDGSTDNRYERRNSGYHLSPSLASNLLARMSTVLVLTVVECARDRGCEIAGTSCRPRAMEEGFTAAASSILNGVICRLSPAATHYTLHPSSSSSISIMSILAQQQ